MGNSWKPHGDNLLHILLLQAKITSITCNYYSHLFHLTWSSELTVTFVKEFKMMFYVFALFFIDRETGVTMVPPVSQRTVAAARDHLSVLRLLWDEPIRPAQLHQNVQRTRFRFAADQQTLSRQEHGRIGWPHRVREPHSFKTIYLPPESVNQNSPDPSQYAHKTSEAVLWCHLAYMLGGGASMDLNFFSCTSHRCLIWLGSGEFVVL